jgi:hypothetical protein
VDDKRARESRVVITMNGKWLPYNEQRVEENVAFKGRNRRGGNNNSKPRKKSQENKGGDEQQK